MKFLNKEPSREEQRRERVRKKLQYLLSDERKAKVESRINEFAISFRNKYGERAEESWEEMTLFEMMKKYIAEFEPIFHPYWDELFLLKTEVRAKTNQSVREKYFSPWTGYTPLKLAVYLEFESLLEKGKLKHSERCGDYTILWEISNGQHYSTVLDNKNKKVFFFKDLLIHGWDYPNTVFVEDVALCYTEKEKNQHLYGLVNTEEQIIVPLELEWLNDRLIGNNLVKFKKNGKFGYMNLKGEVVLQPIYDEILGDTVTDTIPQLGYLIFKLGNKYGLRDWYLNEMLPCIYEEIWVYDSAGFVEEEYYRFVLTLPGKKPETYCLLDGKLELFTGDDS